MGGTENAGLSPLVFQSAYFTANYNKKPDNSMVEAKKAWLAGLRKTYPHCKQGVASFSPNQYYRANTHQMQVGGSAPTCKSIVQVMRTLGHSDRRWFSLLVSAQHYLTVGVYNGMKTYSASAERLAHADVKAQKQHLEQLQGNAVGVPLRLPHGSNSKFSWNLATTDGAGDFGPKVIDAKGTYSYT